MKFKTTKRFLRTTYFRLRRTIRNSQKSNVCHIDASQFNVKIEKLSIGKLQTFFGYYDITPFNPHSNKILACGTDCTQRSPQKNETLQLAYFIRKKNNTYDYKIVDTTETWCWQQGCRLQWFNHGVDDWIIYNKIINHQYGAIIKDLNKSDDSSISCYKMPIYCIDDTSKWALSLNFSRLGRLRPGYGYSTLKDKSMSNHAPEDDGIYLMDLSTGDVELIISLKQLSLFNPLHTMNGAQHYVNHLAFNRDGNRFMFFHLWDKDGKRYNRLITCNKDGQDLYIVEDKGICSHYFWKTNEEMIITNFDEKLRLKYILYTDKTKKRNIIGENDLTTDGHPTFRSDNQLLLTDTYPDKFGEQHLILYSEKKGISKIATFKSPAKFYDELRCDLHPRWSDDGKEICVDSVQGGKRSIYLIHLDSKK